MRRDQIGSKAFLGGRPHTIYVSAPLENQERFRPSFSALLPEAIDATCGHAA